MLAGVVYGEGGEGMNIVASIENRPISMASTVIPPPFACCNCDIYDRHGELQKRQPKAFVFICSRCGHTSCPDCTIKGLCLGCAYEVSP